MSEHTTISIPTDSDGFISRKCPACSKLFKAKYGEGSDQPLSHCPYCGSSDADWFTDEQRVYVRAAGLNFARGIMGREIGKIAQKFNRGMGRGGFITAQMSHTTSPNKPLPPIPVESDEPMAIALFDCCNERVKHDGSLEALHCVICGKIASV